MQIYTTYAIYAHFPISLFPGESIFPGAKRAATLSVSIGLSRYLRTECLALITSKSSIRKIIV